MAHRSHRKIGISRARKLRKNSTFAERRLWTHLRAHRFKGLGFRRQHPIAGHIVDFYCPRARLAIEIDGGQHGWRREQLKDRKRTTALQERGVTVIRFWNNDVVDNLEGVLFRIGEALESLLGRPQSRSSPTSSAAFGGRRRIKVHTIENMKKHGVLAKARSDKAGAVGAHNPYHEGG